MGKGISNRQRAIMKIIADNPGSVESVYRQIRTTLFPEVEYITPYRERSKEITDLFTKHGYDLEVYQQWRDSDGREVKQQRERLKADPDRKAKLNRIRVAISRAVKGLEVRGYVIREGGKLSINANAYGG